jgi:filamentous hemagglutinin
LQDNWQVYKIAKVVKSDSIPKARSLSNLHARQWYVNQLARIPKIMDQTKPLEYQARQAFEFRNQVRTNARNAMYDRSMADELFGSKPNMTWEQTVEKYMTSGLRGDALYREIIKASQRSNPIIDRNLGIRHK